LFDHFEATVPRKPYGSGDGPLAYAARSRGRPKLPVERIDGPHAGRAACRAIAWAGLRQSAPV